MKPLWTILHAPICTELQFCNDVLGTTLTFGLMDNHVAGLYIVVYSLVKV